MKRYPIKISYTAKTAIWAGTRLRDEFGKVSEFDSISESWELSVRRDEMARVLNGEACGMTLSEYFLRVGYDCVCPDFKAGDDFPLLVKLIDTQDMLSVQVHPNDDYARAVENACGKTEMWYIVDAEDNAQLIYGLKDGVTREELVRAVNENRVNDIMNYIPVKKGETYFICSGMIHAIGAGILIAEIQQNSDLTYRLYDFDRVGKDGMPRQLHIDKALDVARLFTPEEIDAVRYSRGSGDEQLLANSEYFRVRRVCVDEQIKLVATSESFICIVCLDGEGSIDFEGEKYPITKGESYFIPAGMGIFALNGRLELILAQT